MRRLMLFPLLAVALTAIAWAAPTLRAAEEQADPLARARLLYNQRLFDEAIAAADEGRIAGERADSADLIAARAYLERYRESAAAEDLTEARQRLRGIDPGRFESRERTEYIIGLGQALYFEESPGAAAHVFASVLDGIDGLLPDARERVLDWWATALDREARPRPELDRDAIYQRIRDRMNGELAINPASSVAAYWLAAAAAGQGEWQVAWEAAQAGWVRAPLTPDHGAALRADLDRLVHRAVAPERAKVLAQPTETLVSEWEAFKEKWTR